MHMHISMPVFMRADEVDYYYFWVYLKFIGTFFTMHADVVDNFKAYLKITYECYLGSSSSS